MFVRAVFGQVAIGNTAQYRADFINNQLKLIHQVLCGLGEGMDFVPALYFWHGTVKVPCGETPKAFGTPYDGSGNGVIYNNYGSYNHNQAEDNTEDKLYHVSLIGILHEFIQINGNSNAPAIGSRDGGITLNIVRVVFCVAESFHAGFSRNHFAFYGGQCLIVFILGKLCRKADDVLLIQHGL